MSNYDVFQMKLYADEKRRLESLAEAAGVDKSAFVKKRIFSDDRIIILDKSQYISRSLIEISDQLRAMMRDGNASEKTITKTYAQLCSVHEAFMRICDELTIFKEGCEDNVDS